MPEPPAAVSRPKALAGALAVAAATMALMVATEPWLAIAWDEGYTLGREARVRSWLRAMADPPGFAASWQPPRQELILNEQPPPPPREIDSRAELLAPEAIAWFWPFAREEPDGHPPFYALVGLLGDVLAPGLADLPRARIGPMLAFSLTAGALFGFVARRRGVWAGALAAGGWVLPPRLFAHGHYAAYDALLSGLWVTSILAFAGAVEPREGPAARRPCWGWVVVFGVLAGWAADTKFTGWFLPLPFLAWTVLYRDRRGALTLLVGGLIGVATLIAFNPAWWGDLPSGVVRFLRSNLTRAETIPITVMFLGHIYKTPAESLPPYNTLAWTAMVTPVLLLGLGLAGAVRILRHPRADRLGMLALGHWAFLLILRALPHTPGHDGVRLFLPAFGCLALVAGLGIPPAPPRWLKGLIAAALAEAAVSIAVMMPVPLSYYSPVVGGLPGAYRLGMEPTYYWDALDDETLRWLNDHTPPGGKVAFATFPTSWLYLQRAGKLRMGLLPNEPGAVAWYVLQNRTGGLRTIDRALLGEARPALVVRKLGVPLIYVFSYNDVAQIERAARRQGVVP